VHTKSIIQNLLGIKNIVVENVFFEGDIGTESLIIQARTPRKEGNRCGVCGRKAKRYDAGSGVRRWRGLDFGTFKVFIEGASPRVKCHEHGIVAAKAPWARHGSWFTHAFEDMVAWLTLNSSASVVSALMRVEWKTVGNIAKRLYDDRKGKAPSMLDKLVNIGIDETSYKKGHKYMTVIVNHDTGKLIWAAQKHGKKVLDAFFNMLSDEQKASIRHVTADGAGWIADCVAEHCPNAERCIDTFHVVQWATESLDDVRKGVWRDARAGKAKTKGVPGRPVKGTPPKAPDRAAAMKDARYPLLKNPENLTEGQAAKLEMVAMSDGRLYRAYLLKEKLRLLFKLPIADAREEMAAWVKWARRCRIPQFVELQRKVRRHMDAIFATIESGLSNARIEAVNNKIKLTVRMGYGFRNIDNLLALVMLRCSNVTIDLPGRIA
jgi:transposase